MFGKNQVRKQDLYPVDGKLWVQKIFPTIQGEGPLAGERATFVRLAGCNLRCWFCDTDFESSKLRLTPQEILDEVAKHPGDLIVLTGGEPMRQNILGLCAVAASRGYTIQIETAGTLWVPGLDQWCSERLVELVCSPKTPHVHEKIETWCWHYKYIIRKGELCADDGLPCTSTQRKGEVAKLYRPVNEAATIWVQPCEEYMHTHLGADPAQWIPVSMNAVVDHAATRQNIKLCAELVIKHGYRLSLQQHKIIGVE